MTDREKKIAEIKQKVEDTKKFREAFGMKNGDEMLEAMEYLLSELERKDKENWKLREERDSWERVARKVEEEKQVLIEGMQWYAKGTAFANGDKARDILKSIGIDV